MKKVILYSFCVLAGLAGGCKKDNYPGAVLSPYIAIYDVRNLYKGSDVTLTPDNMGGAEDITAMVVSDHSGSNLPEGLLVVQDARRLSQLRGISIPLGADAATFVPGDSVTIKVSGAVLKKVNGILEITGIKKEAITRVSSGNSIALNRVPASKILTNPDAYESVLSVIVKGGFDPLPKAGETLAGSKILNDGFGNITLRTDEKAAFAGQAMVANANYTGISFNTTATDSTGVAVPEFRIRTGNDIKLLGTTISVAPVVISGFMSDVKGSDGNYEYVQLLATQDIDFSKTPYAVVVTNNANASTPSGYPSKGWATGDMRTFKFSLTSGKAAKGTFFYVGGSGKTINGSGSTSMASSNWIRAFNYTTTNGDDFGTKTGGLFANSGNASGVAVFNSNIVTVDSEPVDVLFVATGGSLYTASPVPAGYKITNTDFYDKIDPITLKTQPYYQNGSNTLSLSYYTADVGYWNNMAGEYNVTLGKWTKARTQTGIVLSKTSAISEIEGDAATKLKF
ncbi:DUF5689 domain-containing protein [Deminuibacter soli]|uniref:DUF5689 domain-containing protein n=1 Tax=Deminuibacter soli TaxID=2291815 RepID=A0A3E1NGF9_9BACT|nr:DUF5689 domain-containing protein [Deminuibacter soli]RFM27050.1 hypothetical protein DXN05_16405 [Deminuibacter soli]